VQGRTWEVQGYEDHALRYLAQRLDLNTVVHSVEDGKPVFSYRHPDGNIRKYIPDFLVKRTVVEVKSPYTLGMKNPELLIACKRKAKAAMKAGYAFQLLVFNREGDLLPYPRNWHQLSHASLFTKARRA